MHSYSIQLGDEGEARGRHADLIVSKIQSYERRKPDMICRERMIRIRLISIMG